MQQEFMIFRYTVNKKGNRGKKEDEKNKKT